MGWWHRNRSAERPPLAQRPGYRRLVLIRVLLLAVLLAVSLFFQPTGWSGMEVWLVRLALIGGIAVGTVWLVRNPPVTQSEP